MLRILKWIWDIFIIGEPKVYALWNAPQRRKVYAAACEEMEGEDRLAIEAEVKTALAI